LFFEGITYDSILAAEACDLLKEFWEEEVWKANNDLGKEKASGLDGFHIAFSYHCWSIVKRQIIGLFSEFHSKGVFEKSLNATFISLIPKMRGANDINKFRPIGFVGSVYKILA